MKLNNSHPSKPSSLPYLQIDHGRRRRTYTAVPRCAPSVSERTADNLIRRRRYSIQVDQRQDRKGYLEAMRPSAATGAPYLEHRITIEFRHHRAICPDLQLVFLKPPQ